MGNFCNTAMAIGGFTNKVMVFAFEISTDTGTNYNRLKPSTMG